MAEYIDRGAVNRISFTDAVLIDGEVRIEKIALVRDIEKLPAADVAPVRHGRWVLDEYARYFRCSACGTQFDDETDTYCNIMNGFAPNYCEDCGAKMDGTKGE